MTQTKVSKMWEEILKGRVKEGQTIKVSYVKAKEKIVIKVE